MRVLFHPAWIGSAVATKTCLFQPGPYHPCVATGTILETRFSASGKELDGKVRTLDWRTVAALSLACFGLTGIIHAVCRFRRWVTPRRLGRTRVTEDPTSEGGAAFVAGFVLSLLVSVRFIGQDLLLSPREMEAHHLGLALGILWIWAVGRWGDAKGHPHFFTILVIMVGGAVAAGFGFTIHTIRLGERIFELGGFSIPVTLVWFVVISEFFRLFEGLDGLMVLLVLLAIGLQLAVLGEEEGYARLLCTATLPPLMGLLPWRIYPARVEMRGIGAFLPGFVFGAITMVGREKAFTTKAVILPVLVLIAVVSLLCLWILEQRLFLPRRRKER